MSYIADHTVLEMSSTLGDICRTNHWSVQKFDYLERLFMKDIELGQLNVRETTQRDVEQARHLIRFAGVVMGRQLRTGDALISTCCREFALEIKKRIIFVTHDWTLYSTLKTISAFRSALRLRYLDPSKR